MKDRRIVEIAAAKAAAYKNDQLVIRGGRFER